jgi:hypothetical protein
MIISFAEDVVFVFVSTRAMRIDNAKQFLKENLIEIVACAARIHDLNQANQEDEKAECFHFYEVDDLYCGFRSGVKKQERDVWNAKQEKKKIKRRDDDENDDVQFIVNTMSDSNLRLQMNESMKKQADYMTFDFDDEDHFEHDDEDDYLN